MDFESRFESRLQELIEFKQEFGHCQVDRKNHSSLYGWWMQIRKYYRLKNPVLTPERIAKLDALGVVWDVDETQQIRTFEARVEQCRDFKEKHGHLRVPLITEPNEDGNEPTNDDVRFRVWSESMRQQYKKRSIGTQVRLDKHSIAILDNLGFQWSIDAISSDVEGGSNMDADNQTPKEIMFRTRIEQLRKVKEIYGNCNEKKNILSVYPNNNALIKWMKVQRFNMKHGHTSARLTEERQEMLRSIDFDFNPRRHYTAPTTNKKTWPTKMEILELEIQEKRKNKNHYQDLENTHSDDSVIE